MTHPDIQKLDVDGRQIAYRLRQGRSPMLAFLPGYASDMEGTKALALDDFAARLGLSMLRFDYSGTGSSGGRFEEATLEGWVDEAARLIDRLTTGPLVLVGSSMGGWIALHLALRRPKRVIGVVGIAAAPDFTEWGYTDAQKATLAADRRLELPNPNGPEPEVTTLGFWESGQELRLLGHEIAIDCPVRLIHGYADDEVPLEVAFRLMERLRSADIQLKIVKGGGHRLSAAHEIDAILHTVASLLEPSP